MPGLGCATRPACFSEVECPQCACLPKCPERFNIQVNPKNPSCPSFTLNACRHTEVQDFIGHCGMFYTMATGRPLPYWSSLFFNGEELCNCPGETLGEFGIRKTRNSKKPVQLALVNQGPDVVVSCANCERVEFIVVKFKKCGKCKQVAYCSRECQAAHWKVHRKVCRPAKNTCSC